MKSIFSVVLGVFLLAGPARAELIFCNDTDIQASVAIGFKDGDNWVSEGWWTMPAGECATPVKGNLKNRYYYWRASNENGIFRTEDYYFCVSKKEFTIVGDTECEDRGYERHPFVEVDTGEARDATIRLTNADAPLGRKSRINTNDNSRSNSNSNSGSATVTAQPDTQTETQSQSQSQPQTQPVTHDFATIEADLQGLWQDASDDAFATLVSGTHFVDKFAGVPGAEADFRLADTCDGADGAGPVMLVNYDGVGDDTLCWVLLKVSEDELSFRAIGGARDVHMIKKK